MVQKSRVQVMKMPWKSMERGDKEAKIQGRMYEIKENPRGGG